MPPVSLPPKARDNSLAPANKYDPPSTNEAVPCKNSGIRIIKIKETGIAMAFETRAK